MPPVGKRRIVFTVVVDEDTEFPWDVNLARQWFIENFDKDAAKEEGLILEWVDFPNGMYGDPIDDDVDDY